MFSRSMMTAMTALGLAMDFGGRDSSSASQIDGCLECQSILVECPSTSKDEAQFVLCRDQWLECQRGRSLQANDCRNPGDMDACSLCQSRLKECQNTPTQSDCTAEFSVCKAFLITRNDAQQQCTEDSSPQAAVTCGVCQKDFVSCVSDGSGANTTGMCGSKFEQCKTTNNLAGGSCSVPLGQDACTLCNDVFEGCDAAGGTGCRDDFDACVANISQYEPMSCALVNDPGANGTGGSGGSPDTDPGTGGSGGDPGAGSGGGSTGGSCDHDECSAGSALDSTCSSCSMQVCATDAFCCDTYWDSTCVTAAAAIPACGCAG
jgi:hypothetical protein